MEKLKISKFSEFLNTFQNNFTKPDVASTIDPFIFIWTPMSQKSPIFPCHRGPIFKHEFFKNGFQYQ